MKIIKAFVAAAVLALSAGPAVAVNPGLYMEITMYSDYTLQTVVGQFFYFCDGTVTHWGDLSPIQEITGGGDC